MPRDGIMLSHVAAASEDLALVDAAGDPAQLALDEGIGSGLEVGRHDRKERVEGDAHGQVPFC